MGEMGGKAGWLTWPLNGITWRTLKRHVPKEEEKRKGEVGGQQRKERVGIFLYGFGGSCEVGVEVAV
jgi:hypothetical protein